MLHLRYGKAIFIRINGSCRLRRFPCALQELLLQPFALIDARDQIALGFAVPLLQEA
jgi:hypothetical protein